MSENSAERDTTEYGPYLSGEGLELDELHEQYDPIVSAFKGYRVFTVYERDLASFETLEELQAWLAKACNLSQQKPTGRRTHAPPLEKHVWGPHVSLPEWFAPTAMSEGHGWETPRIRLDFSQEPGEQLRDTYMCTLLNFVKPFLKDVSSRSQTYFDESDVIVFSFEASGQTLVVPSRESMLNVTIDQDGFAAEVTCHYAPPRKRYLSDFRAHREQWARWYENQPELSPAELEAGASKMERAVEALLGGATGEKR